MLELKLIQISMNYDITTEKQSTASRVFMRHKECIDID